MRGPPCSETVFEVRAAAPPFHELHLPARGDPPIQIPISTSKIAKTEWRTQTMPNQHFKHSCSMQQSPDSNMLSAKIRFIDVRNV